MFCFGKTESRDDAINVLVDSSNCVALVNESGTVLAVSDDYDVGY